MANMSANMTSSLPPLPSYTLTPREPFLSWISDDYLVAVLPVLAYWGFSMFFHLIDQYDLFPQYRLHTPAEVLKRNHVSRWEVLRDVVIQQIVQTIVAIAISWTEPPQLAGKNDYNVAVWAQRIRIAQQGVPPALALIGLNSQQMAKNLVASSPNVAAVLSGGQYPWLTTMTQQGPVAAFASWEMLAAKAIYWVGLQTLQFGAAIAIVDTWQYFLHRAMHMNRWLYTTFHSRHHRLYVPYAYGALYNHPLEGFLLDTVGAGGAYMLTGMTPRQAMWFFTGSTIKTVDDHCGYALPWDPLQHLTSNNAGYHDVHHQSWGIKTNFSQPFFTFWDRLLGTVWTGGDVSLRYERARLAAERKVAADAPITKSESVESIANSAAPTPYTSATDPDIPDATSTNFRHVQKISRPAPPSGKAKIQALSSRAQVLTDPSPAGGASVLAEETAEENAEAAAAAARARAPASVPAKSRSRKNGSGSGEWMKGLLGVGGGNGGVVKGCTGRGLSVGYDGGR